jgi:hypothetical protein
MKIQWLGQRTPNRMWAHRSTVERVCNPVSIQSHVYVNVFVISCIEFYRIHFWGGGGGARKILKNGEK